MYQKLFLLWKQSGNLPNSPRKIISVMINCDSLLRVCQYRAICILIITKLLKNSFMLNHEPNVFAILIGEIIIGEINVLNIYPFYFCSFPATKAHYVHYMYTIGDHV